MKLYARRVNMRGPYHGDFAPWYNNVQRAARNEIVKARLEVSVPLLWNKMHELVLPYIMEDEPGLYMSYVEVPEEEVSLFLLRWS